MDKLQEIIRTFSKDDVAEFKSFINRLKKKSNRKDLELFDLLNGKKTYKGDDLLTLLYNDPKNVEAYHATRKRLMKQLADYIHYKKINETANNESKVLSLYYLSQHLFEEGKDQIAWAYIKKAEQIAEKQKLFSILHKIYLLQMEFSNSSFAETFPTIIRKKKLNLEKLYKTDNIITAQKVIKNRLNEVLKENSDFQIELLIKNVVADHDLGNVLDEDPDFLFSIIKTVEDVVKVNHNYASFERYLISTYNEFKESISSNQLTKQLEFLFMIGHTLFMNKNYPLSEKYFAELKDLLENASATKKAYYLTYIANIHSKIKTYSAKPVEAITILKNYLDHAENLTPESKLNTEILLCFNYFVLKQYDEIQHLFDESKHSDAWCVKVAGDKWGVKKSTLMAMIAYQHQDYTTFDSQIRLLQREYEMYLSDPENTFWSKLFKTFNQLETATLKQEEQSLIPEIIKLKQASKKLMDNTEGFVAFSWLEAICTRKEFYSNSLNLQSTID